MQRFAGLEMFLAADLTSRVEDVRHVHLHVLPRTRALPAGNIPIGAWYALLQRLRLYQAYSDDHVVQVASMLRAAFAQLEL